MKIRFIRKVIPAQVDKRNMALKKLVCFKGIKENQDVVQRLRTISRSFKERIEYYVEYKGVLFYIGDESLPKKYFISFKNHAFFSEHIKQQRAERSQFKEVYKEKYISTAKEMLGYSLIGNVHTKPGYFASVGKKINRKKVFVFKRPKTNDSYIGIELEYATKFNHDQIADLLLENNLHDKVRVMNDASIKRQTNYQNTVELCILTKLKDLSTTLNQLKKVINSDNFYANDSCGLHVHLDVRYRPPERVYKNLVCMQSLLFRLADESRQGNKFCIPVTDTEFYSADPHNHYAAISKFSYHKHNTIEVRIHHSTTDLNLVEKWINLLVKIADYEVLENSDNAPLKLSGLDDCISQLKEKIKPGPELLEYVERTVS